MDFKKYKTILDRLPKYLFIFSISILVFGYGFFTHRNHIFPYAFLQQSTAEIKLLFSDIIGDKDCYRKSNYTEMIPTYDKNAAYNGLSLVSSVVDNDSLSIRVINMDGVVIHEWNIDWFDMWSDATHLPDESIPKSRPGTHIHGVVLLEDGDVIFNFEHLGLVRLDVCGNIVWRLPYRTHHSIYRDEYDNLWIPGQKRHTNNLPGLPNHKPPFFEPIVLKVSLTGEILNEISIIDLLKENDLQSLLFMSSIDNALTEVSGDTLHLNDIEVFPSFKKEGFFKAGDIMVSLRNINTILFFREEDRKVKYVNIGGFVRQHDPDFIDGNTISIFDNNNIGPEDYGQQSRIIIKSFPDNQSQVYYSGSDDTPFYTDIMGKHQWLKNGNLLITESMKGRVFEIDKSGKIVWEYINITSTGYVGWLEETQRLTSNYTKEFFDQKAQQCRNKN